MATTTENLGLTIPAGTDRAEISVLNENFQKLDTFAGQATDDIQQAQETANAAAPQSTTYTKTEVDTALDEKVDKVSGKGLSTNDFTTAEKNKLSGIEAGATKTIVDAALSSTSTNPVQNKSVQAPVARLVDAGAKNSLKITATSQTISGVTFNPDPNVGKVNSSGSITDASSATFTCFETTLPAGRYHYSCIGAAQRNKVDSFVQDVSGDTPTLLARDYEQQEFTIANSTPIRVRLRVYTGYESSEFYPMLCTAEDYAISPEFVPYAPSNRELYEEVGTKTSLEDILGIGTTIASNADMDSLTGIGKWYCSNAKIGATVTNAPFTDTGYFGWTIRSIATSDRYVQIAIKNSDDFVIAKRRYSGIWSAWSYLTGTEVT